MTFRLISLKPIAVNPDTETKRSQPAVTGSPRSQSAVTPQSTCSTRPWSWRESLGGCWRQRRRRCGPRRGRRWRREGRRHRGCWEVPSPRCRILSGIANGVAPHVMLLHLMQETKQRLGRQRRRGGGVGGFGGPPLEVPTPRRGTLCLVCRPYLYKYECFYKYGRCLVIWPKVKSVVVIWPKVRRYYTFKSGARTDQALCTGRCCYCSPRHTIPLPLRNEGSK
jgi:hypothetical protein